RRYSALFAFHADWRSASVGGCVAAAPEEVADRPCAFAGVERTNTDPQSAPRTIAFDIIALRMTGRGQIERILLEPPLNQLPGLAPAQREADLIMPNGRLSSSDDRRTALRATWAHSVTTYQLPIRKFPNSTLAPFLILMGALRKKYLM